MGLTDFYKEIERGCKYIITANIAHNANIAMLEAPFLEKNIKRVKYTIIPVNIIKEKTFRIKKGELGDLIDIGFSEQDIIFFRIQWKEAIQVYYRNPVYIRNKIYPLEELFQVEKIEPSKTRINHP